MALLAEQIVEEWLNRTGFFTVRGLKFGVQEIDLLAVRPDKENRGQLEAWHVEVQVSFNPNAYISKLSNDQMSELGTQNRNSAKKRSPELLGRTVSDWIGKKYKATKKQEMRDRLWPTLNWRYKLVHGNVKWQDELECIKQMDVELIAFSAILHELVNDAAKFKAQSGADLVDIVHFLVTDKKKN